MLYEYHLLCHTYNILSPFPRIAASQMPELQHKLEFLAADQGIYMAEICRNLIWLQQQLCFIAQQAKKAAVQR